MWPAQPAQPMKLGRFLELLHASLNIFRPARIGRKRLALFEHQLLEFLDAQILHQKFDPSAVAVLLLAEPRKDSGDGLRERQHLFRRNKGVEQFGLIGNGAEASADVHFETAALPFPSSFARGRDEAEIVQAGQAAGMLRASAERRLEFAAEILAIGMAEQELRQRARAYGVTSKTSSVQTPAYGQAVTLRTEFPQASRVVIFAAARRRIRLGVSSMWM